MTIKSFLAETGSREGEVTFSGMKGAFIGTGTKVSCADGKVYEFVISGDIDGDGMVSASDYILIKKCCLGLNPLSGVYKNAADIDGNGKIDSTDYINVKRIILNIK